jgi:hypothetical protein
MRSQHANYTLRQHYSGKLRLTGNPMKSHAVKITSAVSMIGLSLSFVLSFVTFVAPTRPSRVIPHLHKHLLRVALAHAWRPWGLKLEVGMEDGVTDTNAHRDRDQRVRVADIGWHVQRRCGWH